MVVEGESCLNAVLGYLVSIQWSTFDKVLDQHKFQQGMFVLGIAGL